MNAMLERAGVAAAHVLPHYDVLAAYVFGSQARGDSQASSDLDIRLIRGNTLDFGDLDEIRSELARRCSTDVDVICAREQDIEESLLRQMSREQVLIYER